MSKGLCSRIVVASITLTGMVMIASAHAWAAPYRLIGDSGQTLSSVFEGLPSNPALRPDQLAKYQPLRRPWRGILSDRLPGLFRVHFTEGDNCATNPCTGNFVVLVPQPGGCAQPGCPNPNDFQIDVQQGDCTIGEFDSPCFDGVTCCTNAVECESPNTVGCHH